MRRISISILAIFSLFQITAKNLSNDIFEAARNGDTATINSLLLNEPDAINSVNQNDHTPLILAAYHNKLDVVNLLIRKGADVNYSFSQGSAIHGAAFKGYFEIADILIKNGIDLNLPDENGSTPIIYATLFSHNEVAKLLFEGGADANRKDKTGSSALDYAISLSNSGLIELFDANK